MSSRIEIVLKTVKNGEKNAGLVNAYSSATASVKVPGLKSNELGTLANLVSAEAVEYCHRRLCTA